MREMNGTKKLIELILFKDFSNYLLSYPTAHAQWTIDRLIALASLASKEIAEQEASQLCTCDHCRGLANERESGEQE